MLKNFDLRWYPDAALTVVMAAKGYPGATAKGSVIEGLQAAAEIEGVEIFHAGTKADGGRILANGGRVLDVCALGKTVGEAQARAYRAVDRIRWPEGFCRRDIGFRAVQRERWKNRKPRCCAKARARLCCFTGDSFCKGVAAGPLNQFERLRTSASMPDLADLYPGFASHWIDTAAGRIFARSGGEGPPLLSFTAIRRPT
jgi:Phosphoribosylamine-glycine ligase